MKKTLIVDDDRNILTTLEVYLEDKGFEVSTATSGAKGLALFQQERPDLVLLDMRLPDHDGLDVLKEIIASGIRTQVLMITAYASIETAVSAVKMGAFDYLPKPFVPGQLDLVLERLKRFDSLEEEVAKLRGIFSEGGILTRNRKMRRILQTARQAAESNAIILISGESGTGKELIATSIHENSERDDKPFIKLNCAAIPADLLESELFGHEKGAFTGATKFKPGKFDMADGGTIFLDEIGDMPLNLQAKILRVLQEQEFYRVGGSRTIKVDVRIIASTNKNLEKMVQEGTFREDLFYRLNVFTLHLPPLRERKEDIPLLVDYFLQNAPRQVDISSVALQMLIAYSWPGNIRELKNTIDSAAVIAENGYIEPAQLSNKITGIFDNSDRTDVKLPVNIPLDERLREIEKSMIIEALRKTGGVQVRATELLGINQRSLWHRIKKHNIDVKSIKSNEI
ncbi:MAG: sigma-54-dependent Fis family transcriptional regulator [Desulfobacterales bacterium]|nr:MAG: sigma-54-dependent Fis family transcriptional regulator [Desulfobacterales bacterium]